MCPTWLLRANQFGNIPGEMKVPEVHSSVVNDFCMNEVLQIHLGILTDLTNVIMEQSLSHGHGLHQKLRLSGPAWGKCVFLCNGKRN